jgi:hypothetical protein
VCNPNHPFATAKIKNNLLVKKRGFMGSTVPLAESGQPLLGTLQEISDQHRFLDAWTVSAALWSPATDVKQLTGEELVFAGRLAMRLGGYRLVTQPSREGTPEKIF